MMPIRYFSMFSGIGGFELGIRRAFNKQFASIEQDRQGRDRVVDKMEYNVLSTKDTPLCVGYSEIDKYAIQIYEKHFKGHKNYGNCTEIKWSNVEDFELLVGGFPCQSFSIAGKRGGFADTRGTLFFEIARCLREKQPRLFLLENVKGLLSHDKGRTFLTILTTLDELGYDCQWQVLNSKNFGVPQNRERVFIVGHLRGTSRPEIFPIGENDKCSKESRGFKSGLWSQSLDSNYYKGADGKRTMISDGCKIRRLTPLECERLQGFPDGWTRFGVDEDGKPVGKRKARTLWIKKEISDTQRYKCLGNAVTVNVIEAIMQGMKGA